MQLDPDTLERMRDVERSLRPSSDALQRTRTKYDARVDASAGTATRARRPRRRRAWLAGGATVAALAAAGWAFLAVAPDRDGDNQLDAASASAALKRAASASAEPAWTPLAPGEFHHVYEIGGVGADIPEAVLEDEDSVVLDVEDQPVNPFANASGKESWFDVRGRGFVIDVAGSRGYADEFPDTFGGGGYGFSSHLERRPERPLRDQMRHGNMVTTYAYPQTDEPATRHSWTRQPGAYEGGRIGSASPAAVAGRSFDERVQLQYWGATYADFAAANAAEPGERRRAALALLDDPRLFRDLHETRAGEFQMVIPGSFGETDESIRAKFRVEQAVKLLARAPLAPALRRELFLILADQPFARSAGGATDALGRRGTEVRFLTKFDDEVPAERVSLETIRGEGIRQGYSAKQLATLTGDAFYDIPAHRQRRTWFIQIIFDERSGELLQEQTYMTARTEIGRPRPWIEQHGDPLTITEQKNEMAGSGSTVFVSRSRETRVEPRSPVCEERPTQMCRYTG